MVSGGHESGAGTSPGSTTSGPAWVDSGGSDTGEDCCATASIDAAPSFADGGTQPVPGCGPANCAGCCQGSICADGGSDFACGLGGQACQSCGVYGTCSVRTTYAFCEYGIAK
jgi:hypothetical protein